jgi:hypothetical protein
MNDPELRRELEDGENSGFSDYSLQDLLDGLDKDAVRQLENYLLPRIEEARRGDFSSKDFDSIVAEAKAERNTR